MGARENLAALAANPYPGRGICVGLDDAGARALEVYWIMGRSANSRNRVFVVDGATLRTAPADASKVKDPSLIIYNAMRELPGFYIATNGDQTDTIFDRLNSGGTFVQALETRTYEPDPPNNTARISCIVAVARGGASATLAVLKKSPFAEAAERQFFQYEALPKAAGYTITTYLGDANPLPRFEGAPYLLPLEGPARKVAQTLWNALNRENRVSLAVKAIDLATGKSTIEVVNAYARV